MFKKKDDKELNVGRLNELIRLSNIILRILMVFLIIAGVYGAIVILKEVKILSFIFTVLGLIAPLFIGFVIAWLFDPIVTYLNKKGVRRGFGAAICYIVFLGILFVIVGSIIPLLSDQINEFVSNTIPSLYDTLKTWIGDLFGGVKGTEGFDASAVQNDLYAKLEDVAKGLTSSLPETLVTAGKSLFSSLGTFLVSLIIGFYLLLDYDKNATTLYSLIPAAYRNEVKKCLTAVNRPLKKFVVGALIDCSVIFVITAIGFSIIGLKASLLFALFCAITNVIPFAGPYIGGFPAVLVGLTQSTPVGIAVLIFIAIVQALEGNFLQPLIMSKATKLSPITIILGLVVFGHFFSIAGMVLSTPIIGALKELVNYFDEKYDFLSFN